MIWLIHNGENYIIKYSILIICSFRYTWSILYWIAIFAESKYPSFDSSCSCSLERLLWIVFLWSRYNLPSMGQLCWLFLSLYLYRGRVFLGAVDEYSTIWPLSCVSIFTIHLSTPIHRAYPQSFSPSFLHINSRASHSHFTLVSFWLAFCSICSWFIWAIFYRIESVFLSRRLCRRLSCEIIPCSWHTRLKLQDQMSMTDFLGWIGHESYNILSSTCLVKWLSCSFRL